MPVRRVQLLMVAAAVMVLCGLGAPSLGAVVRGAPIALARVRFVPDVTFAPVADAASTTTATTTTTARADPAPTVAPMRPRPLLVISDSVVLGAKDALAQRLPGWPIVVDGRPALTVKQAEAELTSKGQPVAPTVVVALGYKSLWERHRRNYDRWAAQFDQQADQLVTTLRGLGATQIVWVTVRELDASIVPGGWKTQLGRYGWFFPYVNERLEALVQRNADVRLADWSSVAQRPGITRDAIHLNDEGARLMADVIATAVTA